MFFHDFHDDGIKKSLGSDAVLRCNVYKNLIKDLDENITAISYNKSNFFYAFINYYPSVDGNSAFDDYYYPFLTNNECEKYKSLYIKIDNHPKNCTKINLAYGIFLLSIYALQEKNCEKEFDYLLKGHRYYFVSNKEEFAISIPVKSQTIVWKFNKASNLPCEISAW